MKLLDFPVVFLDEASMSTEPASLIPLMRGVRSVLCSLHTINRQAIQAQHLALIGDHKQLPPVVSSPEALAGGLGVSLFERLLTRGGVSARFTPFLSTYGLQVFLPLCSTLSTVCTR
jgi:superfamily I DNA and/or RNA helicase